MKENTRLLCDVTQTSRDGDQELAPPPRAFGVLPSNICWVLRSTLLCFDLRISKLLGVPLPTSGFRSSQIPLEAVLERPADSILGSLASLPTA